MHSALLDVSRWFRWETACALSPPHSPAPPLGSPATSSPAHPHIHFLFFEVINFHVPIFLFLSAFLSSIIFQKFPKHPSQSLETQTTKHMTQILADAYKHSHTHCCVHTLTHSYTLLMCTYTYTHTHKYAHIHMTHTLCIYVQILLCTTILLQT